MRDYVDALNRALEAQLIAVRSLIDDRVKSISDIANERSKTDQMALTLARDNMQRTLDEMNNIREQLASQKGQFVETTEYEAKHEALNVRMKAIETSSASNEAVENYKRWIIGLAVGFVLLFAGVLTNLLLNILHK